MAVNGESGTERKTTTQKQTNKNKDKKTKVGIKTDICVKVENDVS